MPWAGPVSGRRPAALADFTVFGCGVGWQTLLIRRHGAVTGYPPEDGWVQAASVQNRRTRCAGSGTAHQQHHCEHGQKEVNGASPPAAAALAAAALSTAALAAAHGSGGTGSGAAAHGSATSTMAAEGGVFIDPVEARKRQEIEEALAKRRVKLAAKRDEDARKSELYVVWRGRALRRAPLRWSGD